MFSLLRASNSYKICGIWLKNDEDIKVLKFSSFRCNRRRPVVAPAKTNEEDIEYSVNFDGIY